MEASEKGATVNYTESQIATDSHNDQDPHEQEPDQQAVIHSAHVLGEPAEEASPNENAGDVGTLEQEVHQVHNVPDIKESTLEQEAAQIHNDLDIKEAVASEVDAQIAAAVAQKTQIQEDAHTDESTRDEAPKSCTPQVATDIYYLRTIRFKDRTCSIICQNVNGPCPLLALCNVLLLRGTISIHRDRSLVEFQLLVELLTDVLLSKSSQRGSSAVYEQMIQTSIELYPTLQHGMDVNVKFNSCRGFEFTRELELFDIFNVNIYHGWVVDPQDKESALALGSKSYNQVVELVIESQSSEQEGSTMSSEVVQRGVVAESWLMANQSQLTFHGICELHETLGNGELGVLFRNNHFFCVFKHEDEILTLVTDQGFATTPAVWETLSAVNGESVFLDQDFRELNDYSNNQNSDEVNRLQQMSLQGDAQSPGHSQGPESDEALARRLQMEEESIAYQQAAPARTGTRGFYHGPEDDLAFAQQLHQEELQRIEAIHQQSDSRQQSSRPQQGGPQGQGHLVQGLPRNAYASRQNQHQHQQQHHRQQQQQQQRQQQPKKKDCSVM